jgi:hypothetical protein
VRKLVSEWVEAPLQRAMAANPDDYRACSVITVEFSQPPEPSAADQLYAAPAVTVRFE